MGCRNVLRTIFDNIYCSIDTLVQDQLHQVHDKDLVVKVSVLSSISRRMPLINSDIQSILLVGGFGGNRYIHDRLEAAYSSQNIRVLQVDSA